MIIKKIEVLGFGKLVDRSFLFEDGFNVIFGNNEDGKTTLMSFVKMMFFSSSSKSEKAADLFKSLRKKYRPWNKATMGGAIEFEHDGFIYRIQKEFLKSEASDKTTIFCKTTGEEIDIKNKNEAGEHFFKMSLDEFERSVFIGSLGGFSADGASDALAIRLSNLSVSGDENISHEQIIKRLSDAKEELESKTRKKGLLVEAENKYFDLKAKREELVVMEENQKSLRNEISSIESEITALEADLNALKASEKKASALKELNLYYTLKNKLNSLNAAKLQLEGYHVSNEVLCDYLNNANVLDKEISDTSAKIQELALSKADTKIPAEKEEHLFAPDKKINSLTQDLDQLKSHIMPLHEELCKKRKAAFKKSLLLASGIFLASLFISLILYRTENTIPFLWAVPLSIGALAFSLMLLTLKKSSESNISVQLLERDLFLEIRRLSNFEEYIFKESPDNLKNQLEKLLADSQTNLSSELNLLGLENVAQLNKLSEKSKSEEINNLSETLGILKKNFVALSSVVKPLDTYNMAKILFVEVSEVLSSLKSTKEEIESICFLAGISVPSEEFVKEQIKALTNFSANGEEYITKAGVSKETLEDELQKKRALLNEKMKLINNPQKTLLEYDHEISLAEAKINELSRRLLEINIALSVMEEAILDANKGLSSKLSDRTGNYLSKISKGRDSDVLVPRDLNIETRLKEGDAYHEWKYLSGGAIDRVYLALRLAITDIIADGECALPLFFDDILSQYDDQGVNDALEFLKEYLKTSGSASQIMFFTCHKHIYDKAKSIFSDINEVSL